MASDRDRKPPEKRKEKPHHINVAQMQRIILYHPYDKKDSVVSATYIAENQNCNYIISNYAHDFFKYTGRRI